MLEFVVLKFSKPLEEEKFLYRKLSLVTDRNRLTRNEERLLIRIDMKTPLPCGAVAPMEVVSWGRNKVRAEAVHAAAIPLKGLRLCRLV